MKRFISALLTIMIIVPIFSNSINLVHAEENYSVSYRVGPYSFNTDTQGNLFHTIDGTKYYCSDDYEDTAIDKIVSLQNKNVVFELHDNKIAKVYTMDEVLVPQIKVETDVKDGVYYQNGKFSKSSFNLVVKLSNKLSSKFQEIDLLSRITSTEKSRIYNYLTKLEIEPSGNVVDFGSSGWWVWKEYTTNISETMNQKIAVNEIKEYLYEVNLQYVLNMPSYNIELYVTPTFENIKGNRVTNKVKIGNLDYQEEKTEEKKKTSNTGKTVAQASNELSNMQSIVSFTKNYLSSNQKTQINEFVNLWVSELIFAKYVDKSNIKEKVSEKVANKMLNKLGVDTSVMLFPGTINATTYLETESTDGKKVFIEFDVKLMDFDFGNSGMPTMATGSGTATLYDMDGNKLDSSTIIIAFADVCAFCEQLQKVAKDTIFDASKIHLGLVGISAESTAEALSSKMMSTLLNNNYTKKVFKHVDAKDVKKALEKLTATGAKECNNKIFELVTTPKKSSTLVSVDCPVDVTVYDNDGNICAVIKDDVVDSAYEDIFVNVVDSRKNIYLIGDDYSFEITGTDTGTMDYTVTEFDEDGNKTTKIDYSDVQLTNGCKYYSYVPNATNEHQSLFYLTNDKNEVVALEGSCGSNITWSLSEDGVLNINGNGKMSDYHYIISASSYYHTYSPWYSFRNNIKKVVISDGVTSIGGGAFEDCTSLTSITIPDSVTSIGDYAFEDCTSLSDISIPDGITNIGYGAFSSCLSLIDITIPNSVISIENWAFSSCSNLKSIVIPDSVTDIGNYVFSSCINLNDIVIPNSVISIGNYAFSECTSLSNITIPNSVTTIGEYAFIKCTNLKDIVIPDSVGDIGKYAFSECTNLTSIKMPANITIIKEGTFSHCNNLINVIIPNKVTCIESFAFRYCREIECIEIPSSVEQIGEDAFAWCNNLSKVIIGSGIKRIETNAFYKSGQYTPIKTITDVYYSGTLEDWCKIEFENEHSNPVVENFYINNKLITNITISSNIKEISAYTFNGFECLQKVTISNGVSTIGTGAFQWCGRLTSLSISASVTSIEDTAFCDCTKLSTVYYSGTSGQWNQIQIGNNNDELLYATIHCTDKTLSNMSILLDKSNLILYVGNSETLNAIITPEDVPNKTIEWTSSNPNVATVSNGLVSAKSVGTAIITAKTSNGLTATCTVTITSLNEDIFEYTIFKNPGEETSVAIHGYTGSETELTIPNRIEGYPVISIWSEAFIDCTELTEVSIPNSITYIGDDAFRGCINLKEVSIPSSVKGIGAGAFRDCKKLTNITIPSNVTTINSWTFCNCQSLQQIQFKGPIIEIGSHAFCDCYNLKAIEIPSTVTTIGEQAFWGCSKLSAINIPTNITRIEHATFENCTNLNDVHYEGSKSQWEKIYIESDNEYLLNANVHFKTLAIVGDANIDGKVNIKDATLIQKHIAALVTMNEEQLSVSDVNLDGKVNVKDATYIQKFIAGLVSMPEVDVENDTTIPTTAVIEPESITLDNTSLTLNVGESKNLSATVLPDNAVDKSVVWETSDRSIITVSDGIVFAVSVGTATITVKTNNGKTATCEIVVKDVEASNVILSVNELSLKLGEKYSLLATIEPENVADKSIDWSTSDDTIVSVNNGVVKAEKIGVAVITAETVNGIKASCTVTVTPIEAEYITLNTNSLTLKVGEESILTPTVYPENVTDKELTLISSDTSVVIIAGRIISAVGVGNATITVSASNGKCAVCEVVVEEIDASNITLNSNNIELDIGDTYNLIATIEPADVTDKSIVWTTSDSDVATVDKGLVTAKGSGTATITAQTANGLKAVCEITVYMPVSGVYELFLNLRKNPGGCYRLTADDTLNSLDVNLGTFTGCINGDGHTITLNYDVTSKDVTEDCYKALLSKADGAIIKNLNIIGTIDHEMYSDGSYSNYCAGFVAYAENTTFIDCTNESTIKAVVWSDCSGYGYVGGITAWSENCEFINCTNKGDLQITAMPTRIASSVAGGISGQSSNSKFDTCSNTGNIGTHSSNTSDTYYSIAYSGGVVGSSNSSELTNCVTSGNLMANAWPNYETYYTSVAASGGIVAYGNGNLENCSSSCKLNPSATNGGAVYKGELIAYKN